MARRLLSRYAMRVLYLVPPASGGTALARYSFLIEDAHALAAAGVDVFVLSPVPLPPQPRGIHVRVWQERPTVRALAAVAGLTLRQWPPAPIANLHDPATWRGLRVEHAAIELIRAERIDLIHSHFGYPKGFGGVIAGRATGVPVLASFHGTDLLMDRSLNYGRSLDTFYRRMLPGLLRSADATLYYSDFMRREGVRLGADPDTASVIPWGIDVEAFRGTTDPAIARQRLGLPDRPMVLSVSGLIARKGLDTVLRALARLRDTHDFTYVVCGEGPERAALEHLSATLGIADRVRFIGRVARQTMPDYFAAADVFTHGAILEAAGLVLIEAMASSRPVVCTASGGPDEYVAHGTTGTVVPVRDDAAMAAAISAFLADPVASARAGRAGRARAVHAFSRERLTRDLLETYHATVRDRGRRPGQSHELRRPPRVA